MSSQLSRFAFLYAEGPTTRWLRRAVVGIDERLAGLCKPHWPAAEPRGLAPIPVRDPRVRTCGAFAARRAI